MKLIDFNKILIIVSTRTVKYTKIKNELVQKLKEFVTDDNIIIRLTENIESNKVYTREFIKKYTNSLIISIGGDGSISEVSEEIFNQNRDDIYFSFIPNGTGNDFSRTIYPKMDEYDIVNSINDIAIKKIDLIKINDQTCINVAGFGFESRVLENSLIFKKKVPLLNKISFFMGIFMTLTNMQSVKYKYEFTLENGEVIKGEKNTLINAICNAKYYGGGFMPAPEALIDDGLINLNTIDNVSIPRLLTLIGKYKSNKHLEIKESHNILLKSGYIESLDGEITGNIDGNLYKFSKMKFKIIKKALNLVIFKN